MCSLRLLPKTLIRIIPTHGLILLMLTSTNRTAHREAEITALPAVIRTAAIHGIMMTTIILIARDILTIIHTITLRIIIHGVRQAMIPGGVLQVMIPGGVLRMIQAGAHRTIPGTGAEAIPGILIIRTGEATGKK